jgi:hypothetical protein
MAICISYHFLFTWTDISGFRIQAAFTQNKMPLATLLKITIFSVIYQPYLGPPMSFLPLIVYVNTYWTSGKNIVNVHQEVCVFSEVLITGTAWVGTHES